MPSLLYSRILLVSCSGSGCHMRACWWRRCGCFCLDAGEFRSKYPSFSCRRRLSRRGSPIHLAKQRDNVERQDQTLTLRALCMKLPRLTIWVFWFYRRQGVPGSGAEGSWRAGARV